MTALYRIRRVFRPDITGDAHAATALLARKALARLDQGQSPAQVRAWVQHPRQGDRFGLYARKVILTVLAHPTPVEARPEPDYHALHTMVEALSCGDCALIAASLTDCPTEREGITVADVEALLPEDVAA